jgi:uncharacterized protein (DUF433 family)
MVGARQAKERTAALNPSRKVWQAVQADEPIRRHVAPSPHHPGPDEARLVDYGVSVWALVAFQRATGATMAEVADAYGVSAEAVAAAFAYYQQHKDLIDARIAANAVATEADPGVEGLATGQK